MYIHVNNKFHSYFLTWKGLNLLLRLLKEFGDKVPADKKAPIEAALNKLKEAHKSQDVAAVDTAMNELNQAWTAASEELYKAQQAGAPTADAGAQPNAGASDNGTGQQQGGENVTDAEFEEVK